ncbi:hypothetical protein MSG28_008334 [Choristoneura fumiferana]|uniref:Uncharacterized protein n=1 Tax=Choristoneura fumiferana TaxID=7141 RepID=A0ACC0JB22_CHOFU|nr:hypothetical protein MSG28_008334 [Choristoneura fumiferana]
MAMGIDIFGLGIIVTASTCDLGMTLQQIGVLSSMPFAAYQISSDNSTKENKIWEALGIALKITMH